MNQMNEDELDALWAALSVEEKRELLAGYEIKENGTNS